METKIPELIQEEKIPSGYVAENIYHPEELPHLAGNVLDSWAKVWWDSLYAKIEEAEDELEAFYEEFLQEMNESCDAFNARLDKAKLLCIWDYKFKIHREGMGPKFKEDVTKETIEQPVGESNQ